MQYSLTNYCHCFAELVWHLSCAFDKHQRRAESTVLFHDPAAIFRTRPITTKVITIRPHRQVVNQ